MHRRLAQVRLCREPSHARIHLFIRDCCSMGLSVAEKIKVFEENVKSIRGSTAMTSSGKCRMEVNNPAKSSQNRIEIQSKSKSLSKS